MRVRTKEMREVPINEWPLILAITCKALRVWESKDYLAVLYEQPDGYRRLSVNCTRKNAQGEWRDGITWDELYRVKNECLGLETWCVEVYPADSELVRDSNIRHLFVMDEAPEYAWEDGKW